MPTTSRFRDHADAGRALARHLGDRVGSTSVVLALPRGGVPVAREVARAVGAPLEVFVARKVGAPGHEELGIGAVAEGGIVVADDRTMTALGIESDVFDQLVHDERAELERRVLRYRGDRGLPALTGHDVVLVDDGLATGVTAEAALRALRAHEPRSLLLAVPVGAPESLERLIGLADEVHSVRRPSTFGAVGSWYERFDQVTDDEVLALLATAAS